MWCKGQALSMIAVADHSTPTSSGTTPFREEMRELRGELRAVQRIMNGNGERGLVAKVDNLVDDMAATKVDMKAMKESIASLRKTEQERQVTRATEARIFKRAMTIIALVLTLLGVGGGIVGARILGAVNLLR